RHLVGEFGRLVPDLLFGDQYVGDLALVRPVGRVRCGFLGPTVVHPHSSLQRSRLPASASLPRALTATKSPGSHTPPCPRHLPTSSSTARKWPSVRSRAPRSSSHRRSARRRIAGCAAASGSTSSSPLGSRAALSRSSASASSAS